MALHELFMAASLRWTSETSTPATLRALANKSSDGGLYVTWASRLPAHHKQVKIIRFREGATSKEFPQSYGFCTTMTIKTRTSIREHSVRIYNERAFENELCDAK